MRRMAKAMPRSSSRIARGGGTKRPIVQPGSMMRMQAKVANETAASAVH